MITELHKCLKEAFPGEDYSVYSTSYFYGKEFRVITSREGHVLLKVMYIPFPVSISASIPTQSGKSISINCSSVEEFKDTLEIKLLNEDWFKDYLTDLIEYEKNEETGVFD